MSRHTAPDELLLDYATGALAQGPALAVALHVALDPVARRAVGQLDAMGGALMEGEGDAPLDDAALKRTLARLDRIAVEPRPAPAAAAARPGFEWAPPPLARLIGADARWRNVLGGFEEIRLRLPGDSHRVSLLRLEPGKAELSTRWCCRAAIPIRPATTASAILPSAPGPSSTSRSPIPARPASP